MNAGIEIDLGGGNLERFSLFETVINGKQYEGRILELNQNIPGCQEGNYEMQSFTAILEDSDGEVRGTLSDIYGKTVKLIDENGTQRAELIALRPDFSERGKVKLMCSDRFQETESSNVVNDDYEISTENFPSCPESSLGQYYNFFAGNFMTWDTVNFPGKNGLRCWLIDQPVSGTGGTYVMGKTGANTAAHVPAVPQALIDDSGNALATAGWSISLVSGIYYITKAGQANFKYIDVNIQLTAQVTLKEIFQDVGNEFFTNFPFTSSADARDLFAFDKYHLDPEPSKSDSFRDPHYFINDAITGTQILNQLCMGELNYYITPDGEITFHSIDYENVSPEVFQEAEAFEFIEQGNRKDQKRLINEIAVSFGKQAGGAFENTETIRNYQSRVSNGFWQKQPVNNHIYALNSKSVPLPGNGKPLLTSVTKRIFRNNKNIFDEWTLKIHNLTEWIEKDIFNYVKFKHPAFKDDELHTMMILRKRINYKAHTVEIDMQDITFLTTMNLDMKFLFQANPLVEGYKFFDDISVTDYNYTSGGSGSPSQTRTDKKFTTGSVRWNGTNQSRAFGTIERAFIQQIFNYTKWSLAAWIKFPVLNSVEIMLRVQDSADVTNQNFIDIRKRSDNKLQINVFEGGVQKFIMTSSTFTAAINTQYHFMFAKNGNNHGIYIDGVQVGYLSSAYVPVGNPHKVPMWFAEDSQGGNFADYIIYEWGMFSSAKWATSIELNPNAGLTDTYTVPNGAMTDYPDIFYDYSGL